jgi:hypothetical protein
MSARLWALWVVSAAALSVASIAYIALKVKRKERHDSEKKGDEDFSFHAGADIPPHLQRQLYKEQKRREKIPLLALKSPMYDNILMMDPQGQVLSTISYKKAVWYVDRKHLAKWTGASTIQLLIQPRGRSNDAYNTTPKQNICVVCGSSGHVMRHYIVPYAYRSLLPQKYKSHQSHDICILCPTCHLYAEQVYQERMNRLEESLRTDPSTAAVTITDHHLQRVKSVALALSRQIDRLPPDRVREYQSLVRQQLQIHQDQALTQQELQQALQLECRLPNPNYASGATLVVESLVKHQQSPEEAHGRIADFVRDWRHFFVESLQPRHLPAGWSINSPVACSSHKVK